jgi:hypothetical protein
MDRSSISLAKNLSRPVLEPLQPEVKSVKNTWSYTAIPQTSSWRGAQSSTMTEFINIIVFYFCLQLRCIGATSRAVNLSAHMQNTYTARTTQRHTADSK